jgi:hypothetical protein
MSYCRGMLVRGAPPFIREKLIKSLQDPEEGGSVYDLNMFLELFNHPAPGGTVLINTKGMELVKYNLYPANHITVALSTQRGLRALATEAIAGTQMYPGMIRLGIYVKLIHHMITINGTKWGVNSVCEYLGKGGGGAQAIRLGRILHFGVVRYTLGGGVQKSTMFVHLSSFPHDSLTGVGQKSCTHYRVRLSRCTKHTKKETFVHVSALTALLRQVPDNRGESGVPLQTSHPIKCPTGYMYFVPVARAFESRAF